MGIQYGLAFLATLCFFIWFVRDERQRHSDTLKYERERNAEQVLLSKASEAALRSTISSLGITIAELNAKIEAAALIQDTQNANADAYRPHGGVALDAFEAAVEREGLGKLGQWAVQSVDGGEEFVLLPIPKGAVNAG